MSYNTLYTISLLICFISDWYNYSPRLSNRKNHFSHSLFIPLTVLITPPNCLEVYLFPLQTHWHISGPHFLFGLFQQSNRSFAKRLFSIPLSIPSNQLTLLLKSFPLYTKKPTTTITSKQGIYIYNTTWFNAFISTKITFNVPFTYYASIIFRCSHKILSLISAHLLQRLSTSIARPHT